jgi:hypothetical protein
MGGMGFEFRDAVIFIIDIPNTVEILWGWFLFYWRKEGREGLRLVDMMYMNINTHMEYRHIHMNRCSEYHKEIGV